jgi:hypothetical protein
MHLAEASNGGGKAASMKAPVTLSTSEKELVRVAGPPQGYSSRVTDHAARQPSGWVVGNLEFSCHVAGSCTDTGPAAFCSAEGQYIAGHSILSQHFKELESSLPNSHELSPCRQEL